MLDILRKQKGKWWVKALLIAIAVTFFGGFGLLSYCSRQQSRQELERMTAATVDDSRITITDVNRLVQGMTRGQESKSEAEIEKLRKDVLDTLINQEVVYKEAHRLGVVASDDEVRQEIMRTFQIEGVFDQGMYKGYIANQGFTESQFEEQVRKELTVNKMTRLIGSSAVVTDEDVRQMYLYENSQIDLALILVDPESIKDIPEPSADEIKKRFEENPDGYTVPEKRQVRYACFDSKTVGASVTVTEQDIQSLYDQAKVVRYVITPRKVHARQIFFAIDPVMSEEDKNKVKEKAQQVLSDAKLGTSPFDNLAKIYTDDPMTKEKGGDLGWVEIGRNLGPLERAVQNMKPGDISEVIEDPKGYYIFKLEEETPGKYKPLAAVRKEVTEEVRRRAGFKASKTAANSLLETVRDGKAFGEAAKMATAEVKLSPLFEQTATAVEGLPSPEKLVPAAFQMWEENQVSDVQDITNGSCVMQLAKIEDSHTANAEEAVPLVREELMREARKAKAKEIADGLLKKIQGGMAFADAATQPGAQLVETGFFARGKGMIPKVGYSEEMITAAFALPAHQPVGNEVFEVGGKFYLIKVNGTKGADQAGFEKEKGILKMQLTFKRQTELADSWIETLKQKANIVIKEAQPEETEQL